MPKNRRQNGQGIVNISCVKRLEGKDMEIVLQIFLLAIGFAMLIKGYVLILLVVLGLVYEAISLTQAWFIYGRGKIKYKQAVNLKNVGSNVLAAVIIIAIVIALFVLLSFISKFIAVLVIVPVAVYSVNIIGVNDDSYICSLAESRA